MKTNYLNAVFQYHVIEREMKSIMYCTQEEETFTGVNFACVCVCMYIYTYIYVYIYIYIYMMQYNIMKYILPPLPPLTHTQHIHTYIYNII